MFEFVQINKSLNVIFNFILQEVHFIKYSADRLSRQTEYMHWQLQHSLQIMYIVHTSCNQVSLLTNILAKTPLGSIHFWDCVLNHNLHLRPFKISFQRQSMKWSFFISTRAEVSFVSTILRNAPGKVQVCYGAKESSYKTSRNHRSFRKCFY